MKKGILTGTVLALVCGAAMVVKAQMAKPTIHLIGCLQRTAGAITLADARNQVPYRLDLDAKDEWHVGHTVEITGTLTDANSTPPRVKVDSLIYISPSCTK